MGLVPAGDPDLGVLDLHTEVHLLNRSTVWVSSLAGAGIMAHREMLSAPPSESGPGPRGIDEFCGSPIRTDSMQAHAGLGPLGGAHLQIDEYLLADPDSLRHRGLIGQNDRESSVLVEQHQRRPRRDPDDAFIALSPEADLNRKLGHLRADRQAGIPSGCAGVQIFTCVPDPARVGHFAGVRDACVIEGGV